MKKATKRILSIAVTMAILASITVIAFTFTASAVTYSWIPFVDWSASNAAIGNGWGWGHSSLGIVTSPTSSTQVWLERLSVQQGNMADPGFWGIAPGSTGGVIFYDFQYDGNGTKRVVNFNTTWRKTVGGGDYNGAMSPIKIRMYLKRSWYDTVSTPIVPCYNNSVSNTIGSATSAGTGSYYEFDLTPSLWASMNSFGFEFEKVAGGAQVYISDLQILVPDSLPPTTTTESTTETIVPPRDFAQSDITVSYENPDYKITVDNPTSTYTYQYWALAKVSADLSQEVNGGLAFDNEDIYVWTLLGSGFGSSKEAVVPASFKDADGNVTVMVRVKDGGNYIGQWVDSYSPSDMPGASYITKVTAGGIVLTETKSKNGADIGDGPFFKAGVAFPVTVEGAGASLSMPGLSGGMVTLTTPGVYTLTATAGDIVKYYTINIYEDNPVTEYPEINKMTVAKSGGTIKATITGNGVGTYGISLSAWGMSIAGGTEQIGTTANFTPGPGIYNVTAKAYGTDTGAKYQDIYIRTVSIGRGSGSGEANYLKTTSDTITTLGESTTISVDEWNINGYNGAVEFAYYRQDADGLTLLKDWSTAEQIVWKPAIAGNYSIIVRVRGTNAGSYEASSTENFNIGGSSASATVEFFNLETLETINPNNLQARKPVGIRAVGADNLICKFVESSSSADGLTLKGFSPASTCVWTPRKAGSYDISVVVQSAGMYGKGFPSAPVTATVN